MKKTLLTALVVSALTSSVAFAGSSGNIKFTGTVTNETCNFKTYVNGTEKPTLDLLTMNVGDEAGPTVNFSIAPDSADCTQNTTGSVTWSGAGFNKDGIENSAGTAQGIVVEVWATNNGDNANKYLTQNRQTINFTNDSGIKSYDFAARMFKPEDVNAADVKAGTVETTVAYIVTYQ